MFFRYLRRRGAACWRACRAVARHASGSSVARQKPARRRRRLEPSGPVGGWCRRSCKGAVINAGFHPSVVLRHSVFPLILRPLAVKVCEWGVAKWLRHRFLVSAFGGSNPPAPAILKSLLKQRFLVFFLRSIIPGIAVFCDLSFFSFLDSKAYKAPKWCSTC